MKKQGSTSVFAQITAGLEDSVGYSKGALSLKTSKLLVPAPAVSADDVRAFPAMTKVRRGTRSG